MEDIVHQTNLYAQQTMEESQYEKWVDVTVEELKAYLGFCILMGIVKLPSIDDYWKKDPFLHYDPIASRITRDRFRDIRRYLHFVDNKTLPPPGTPGSDRLAKIRPFFNTINEQCMKLYQPQRDVSIDEATVKFQGRSSLKQYLPMKPVKRGIKVWVLADTNGYFWNMQVYTGRETSTEKGLGARVVKDLTVPLHHKFHHIYCDNFFYLSPAIWGSWKSWPLCLWDSQEWQDRVPSTTEENQIDNKVQNRGTYIFQTCTHMYTQNTLILVPTHTHIHTHHTC